jgi:hypothetical protein
MEAEERDDPVEEGLEVVVPHVHPPKNVEDKGMIQHRLAVVTEGIGHALHLSAVVVDVHVTLDEGSAHDVEVESTSLTVDEELLLDGNPNPTGCAAVMDNVLELDSERVEEPGEDDTVHPSPSGKSRGSNFGGDVVVEGVALEGFRIDLSFLPLEGSSVLMLTGGGGSGLGSGEGRGNGGVGGKPSTAMAVLDAVPREGKGSGGQTTSTGHTACGGGWGRGGGEMRERRGLGLELG